MLKIITSDAPWCANYHQHQGVLVVQTPSYSIQTLSACYSRMTWITSRSIDLCCLLNFWSFQNWINLDQDSFWQVEESGISDWWTFVLVMGWRFGFEQISQTLAFDEATLFHCRSLAVISRSSTRSDLSAPHKEYSYKISPPEEKKHILLCFWTRLTLTLSLS